MKLDEYQEKAYSTALPTAKNIGYMLYGMAGEVGELHSIYAKNIRDGKIDADNVKKEIGDVLWFVAGVCSLLGLKLSDIAQLNIDKLESRKNRNTIQGSGDNR